MFTVTIQYEDENSTERGYGIYVNAYVTWDDIDDDIPVIYASECVSFFANTPENIKAAAKRVRSRAHYAAKKEWGRRF